MKPHYHPQKQAVNTRMFIPIQDWIDVKSGSDYNKAGSYETPEWQRELVLKRIQEFENGNEDLLDLDEAMNEIEQGL